MLLLYVIFSVVSSFNSTLSGKLFNMFGRLLSFVLVLGSHIGISQTTQIHPLQSSKLKYAQEVESEALAKKDTLQMAEAYYLYGKVYGAAHDFLNAKKYFIKSLKILEERGDSYQLGRLYCRIALVEMEQLNSAKALAYVRLSLPIFQRIDSKKGIMEAYGHIAHIYSVICTITQNDKITQSACDSVLFYHKKSLSVAYELKDTNAVILGNGLLGELYKVKKNPKAIEHFQAILNHYKETGKIHQEVAILQKMALTYLTFGQVKQAYSTIKESEKLYYKHKMVEAYTEKGFATFYEEYYKNKKDWKNAYRQIRLLYEIEQNQLLADRDGAVSRLAVEYETEKKELQLQNQQNELEYDKKIQNQQRYFIGTLVVLFLGAIVVAIIFYQLFRKNQRLSQQNATLVREQNHRVKNNLQLVSSMLSLQANRLTDEVAKTAIEDSQLRIEVMAILQRKLYDGSNLGMVDMPEFIKELVEIALESFNHEQVEMEYDVPFSLQITADSALRIGLIINEIVTNACKYAFSENTNPVLKVACSLNNQLFKLCIADNGTGFKVVDNVKHQTFGMRLIQIQVQQLKGNYRFINEKGCIFEMDCPIYP